MKKYFYLIFAIALGCVFPRPNENVNIENNDSLSEEVDIWVPIIQNKYGFLVVSGSIHNTECNILIDTGGNESGAVLMDSAFFYNNIDTDGLVLVKPKGRFSFQSESYLGEISVQIGDMVFVANEITIFKQEYSLFRGDINFGVIIGKLYYDKILTVDFDNNKLVFTDSLIFDTFDYSKISMYPPRKRTDVNDKRPIKIHEKYIEVDGFTNKQGKNTKGRFLFDTGCISPLILIPDFGKKLKTPSNYLKYADSFNERDKVALWEWWADTLNIGDIKVPDVKIDQSILGTHPHYIHLGMLDGGDGLMGIELIKRFNFIADFRNNVIYLKPSKYFYEVDSLKIE